MAGTGPRLRPRGLRPGHTLPGRRSTTAAGSGPTGSSVWNSENIIAASWPLQTAPATVVVLPTHHRPAFRSAPPRCCPSAPRGAPRTPSGPSSGCPGSPGPSARRVQVRRKHSVNPPASVQRVPCPRPRPRLAVGSVLGIPRRNLTMRRGYDVSGAGTSSSHPHARLCSGLRFHGRNRSTSSTARPPAWAHASR